MPPVVQFENITKTYSGVPAVNDLNLSIEAGKFVTLLGPSGCGKSTSLRMLGGFEIPDRGRILLAGQDVTRLPPNRRDVNIVFQDYALFPHMNVARNIAFGLELKGLDSAAIRKRVGELLALVQLEDYAARMPSELSGGQRQRVALMRALAPDPQVLLLDEPLSALDAKLRQQMQIELKAIQERTGKTFLFVTHDQEEALTMSDQIVVMNKGRIEQMGDPHTLYAKPASVFVANFIGEANLLPATLKATDNQASHLVWAGREVSAAPMTHAGKPGDNVRIVVRPEALRLLPAGAQATNAFSGRISQRVFKGNHTSLLVAIDGGATINALLRPGDLDGHSGDEVRLSWEPRDATVIPVGGTRS